ncbi:MAG: N-acetyltransferase family protein [Dehalococcoidia bacterium]
MTTATRVTVRPAAAGDIEAIQRIYNDAILTTTATWDEEPWPLERRLAWWQDHNNPLEPILVAEVDGSVAGFAYLTRMSAKSGWRFTRENTIYIDADWRGRGVGRVLLTGLLGEARRIGVHLVVASITDENEASIKLHASLGFETVGTLREAGYKGGRRLNTCYMQLVLEDVRPEDWP